MSDAPYYAEHTRMRDRFVNRVYCLTVFFILVFMVQWMLGLLLMNSKNDRQPFYGCFVVGAILLVVSLIIFLFYKHCGFLVGALQVPHWIFVFIMIEGITLMSMGQAVMLKPVHLFLVMSLVALTLFILIELSMQMPCDITRCVVCLFFFSFLIYTLFIVTLVVHLFFGDIPGMIYLFSVPVIILILIDVKAIDMQLEEYAAETLKEICDYFLQLHSFLQNEERRIIDDFNSKCLEPQIKIRDTFTKLGESQTILNKIRAELELYQHRLPTDIHLQEAFSVYHAQIEQLPCQVQITQLDKKPFLFEVQRDLRKDFAKYYRYEYVDPKICLRIGPMYGDLNRSFQQTDLQSSELDVSHLPSLCSVENKKQRINKKNQQKKQALCHYRSRSSSNTSSSSNARQNAAGNTLARISHVRTPEHFYVQMEQSLSDIRELSNKYVNFTHQDIIAKHITEGRCYMAYHKDDKQWYRAMVKKIMPKDTYKVFLVDVGINMELPKHSLCEMDGKSLNIPFMAIRCAIYDIMPTGKAWTEEANNLLIEITRNQPVRLSIIDQIKDGITKVDLFTTNTDEPISIRDSFLYTGLARERSGVMNSQPQQKKMSPVARLNQRLPRHSFQNGDMLMVKVLHIENPQLFSVMKMDQIEAKHKMKNDLNYMYAGQDKTKHIKPIFVATLQMCCAVFIDNIWHRCSVEEIHSHGKVCVRLVDEGEQREVSWRQIYALHSKFHMQKEFAVSCSLADVEPLQENNYGWTKDAVREFRQLTANPSLQMTILSAKQNDYKVSLHVCKKHMDMNVGAVLAKYGHCLSTGETSQVVEVIKIHNRHLSVPITPSDTTGQGSAAESKERGVDTKIKEPNARPMEPNDKNADVQIKILKRTPIKIVHIIDPGEFYIQIAKLLPGIMKFHQEIQVQKQFANTLESQTRRDWFVGDHCLVRTKFRYSISQHKQINACSANCAEQWEWYRGIIVSYAPEHDAEYPYAVFLRDYGNTVPGVSARQLSAIDSQWDRVTNAVHRCHLTCIEPTGGMATWSHSAIDFFKHTVASFETLSATLQGKRTPGSNSLPIVLWGTITETSDPLAPCLSKHSNVNRILVKAGLAHSAQRLDIAEQLDKLVQMELTEGEITLEEWYKNFEETATLRDMPCNLEKPDEGNDNNMFYEPENPDRNIPLDAHYDLRFSNDLLLNECDDTPVIYTGTAPSAWLRSKHIEKSIFAGSPTYVDFDCIIYMHDSEDEELLSKMQSKILKAYGPEKLENEMGIDYNPGQACIVRYHVDTKFYRGIVQRKTSNGCFVVQFVDYGNVESVEPEHIRPYAPFPKLASIACKFRIEGIQPKHGEKTFSTSVLDYIHKKIVEKLVSARVSISELSKPVKTCTIRIGTVDLADMLVAEGYADRETYAPERAASNELAKRRNALSGYNQLTPALDFDGSPDYVLENINEMKLTNSESSDVDNNLEESDDDNAVNACLDQILTNLDNEELDLKSNGSHVSSLLSAQEQNQETFIPPRKKRMFDSHEYQQLHAQMQYGNLYGSENFMQNEHENMLSDGISAEGNALACPFGIGDDDDDDDIVELEQSFARNYWHAMDNATECKKASNPTESAHMNFAHPKEDPESSDFEKFYPNDTSSVFSHLSGIETFKHPQLPVGIRSFNCNVVSIVSPTILQILPHLTEFEFRDLELQRRIKHLVKTALPLTQFEPRTICLSCYNKDKKWYRALIRSYNPAAKQADVFYVDYLNTESVPIKNLRQCPMELVSYPLRTFKVRLHGVIPHSRMRDKDLRQALQNVLLKRTMFARVKKDPNLDGNTGGREALDSTDRKSDPDAALTEISLYESCESATTIYECLIRDHFFQRI